MPAVDFTPSYCKVGKWNDVEEFNERHRAANGDSRLLFSATYCRALAATENCELAIERKRDFSIFPFTTSGCFDLLSEETRRSVRPCKFSDRFPPRLAPHFRARPENSLALSFSPVSLPERASSPSRDTRENENINTAFRLLAHSMRVQLISFARAIRRTWTRVGRETRGNTFITRFAERSHL